MIVRDSKCLIKYLNIREDSCRYEKKETQAWKEKYGCRHENTTPLVVLFLPALI